MDGVPVGVKQGKVWGWTMRVFRSDTTQVDWAFVRAGFRCSLHHHPVGHNQFLVQSGRLRVTVHKDGLEDVTELGPGEMTVARAGDRHRFEALEDTHVLEVYSVTLPPHDIVRVDQGGPAPVAAPRLTLVPAADDAPVAGAVVPPPPDAVAQFQARLAGAWRVVSPTVEHELRIGPDGALAGGGPSRFEVRACNPGRLTATVAVGSPEYGWTAWYDLAVDDWERPRLLVGSFREGGAVGPMAVRLTRVG